MEPEPLLPARMLNEFVYCPRLFHIEWVDRRWADNEDTAAGQFVHRSVDAKAGPMPMPDDDVAPLTTHSVQLSSERLGLTAVIDRVDHIDGTCSPVDYKKGKPAPGREAWPADRAQSLAQAALLQDAGYRVEKSYVYYAATHERIEVSWTQETATELQQLVHQARSQARAGQCPPPLIDSPKCPRCSLVTLCLPDETNAATGRSAKPRRILPRDPDSRPVYVTDPGSYVSVKGGQIVVSHHKEVVAELRLIDVSQLCVFGNVQISTQALTRLWAQGVHVLWLSYGGWIKGYSFGQVDNYVQLRLEQVRAHENGVKIAQRMVSGKIRNQRTLARRNSRTEVPQPWLQRMAQLSDDAEKADSLDRLLGLEGTAARLYFGRFTSMIRQESPMTAEFDANGRQRRPPPDPLNALLGLVYSLLTKDLVATCIGVGLDPQIGVYHRPRFGRPSLALDLAEEFRALVADSVVLQVVNNGEVGDSDFLALVMVLWVGFVLVRPTFSGVGVVGRARRG